MTFIPKIKSKIEDLFVTTTDVEIIGGTFLKGTILKKNNGSKGYDYSDCDGNGILEKALSPGDIIPLSDAYKLFEAKPRQVQGS